MNGFGRKIKSRNIDADHSSICFKPCGVKRNKLERVILYEDEMEAIRLADFESLYQQECAERMEISRIVPSALISTDGVEDLDPFVNDSIPYVMNKSLKTTMTITDRGFGARWMFIQITKYRRKELIN